MVERLFRTGFTNGHCHYYDFGSRRTKFADGHQHDIIYCNGHAVVIEWEDGHSHNTDSEDLAPLPEVPFGE